MDPADAGHFTTFQVRGGRMQGRDAHLARLVAGSRALYRSSPAGDRIRSVIRDAVLSADPALREACTVRVRVHPPHPGYRGDHVAPGRDDAALRIELDLGPPRQPPAAPLRVRTHAGLRQAPGVKHLALDFQRQAREAARAAGDDDALLLAPDGRISEGTFWNVVFRDGRGWVWPDAPALPGVTRGMLRMEMEKHGEPLRDAPVDLAVLAGMRAAFAVNSTGITAIGAIDGFRLAGDPAAGEALRGFLAAVPWDLP